MTVYRNQVQLPVSPRYIVGFFGYDDGMSSGENKKKTVQITS
ncbi:MAG: hypothetical protein JWM44_958 [Bacilli bacterium]|nr:hypothetical protein [Bacilli bacterium]